MTKLGVEVAEATITSLERRVVRLVALLEIATQKSPNKTIRENGARLADRLAEWMDDIKDLREVGDEDVTELIKSFELRLKLAESKVKDWPLPASARAELEGRPRRRRGKKVRPAA